MNGQTFFKKPCKWGRKLPPLLPSHTAALYDDKVMEYEL